MCVIEINAVFLSGLSPPAFDNGSLPPLLGRRVTQSLRYEPVSAEQCYCCDEHRQGRVSRCVGVLDESNLLVTDSQPSFLDSHYIRSVPTSLHLPVPVSMLLQKSDLLLHLCHRWLSLVRSETVSVVDSLHAKLPTESERSLGSSDSFPSLSAFRCKSSQEYSSGSAL